MKYKKNIYVKDGVVYAVVRIGKTICDSKEYYQTCSEPLIYLWRSNNWKIEYFLKKAHKWADELIEILEENTDKE